MNVRREDENSLRSKNFLSFSCCILAWSVTRFHNLCAVNMSRAFSTLLLVSTVIQSSTVIKVRYFGNFTPSRFPQRNLQKVAFGVLLFMHQKHGPQEKMKKGS